MFAQHKAVKFFKAQKSDSSSSFQLLFFFLQVLLTFIHFMVPIPHLLILCPGASSTDENTINIYKKQTNKPKNLHKIPIRRIVISFRNMTAQTPP